MKPVLAIVGKCNVGKSTLFNYLTKTRNALVSDYYGLTCDRQYGLGKINDKEFIIIDTGGLTYDSNTLDKLKEQQVVMAIKEANLVLFVVDASDGLTTIDENIAKFVRQFDKPLALLKNKIDAKHSLDTSLDFYNIGIANQYQISAKTGRGIKTAFESILDELNLNNKQTAFTNTLEDDESINSDIKVAVIGRPNVGKSTLINTIIGENRLVTYDMPFTTQDSIDVRHFRHQKFFRFTDTAGIRTRKNITAKVEKFSIVKTLQSIEKSNIVILLVDSNEGITEQDLRLLGICIHSGRGLIVGLNKWDSVTVQQRENVQQTLERKLRFADYVVTHKLSGLTGSGIDSLFKSIKLVYKNCFTDLKTSRVNQVLLNAIETNPPPKYQGKDIRLRYAHSGGKNPPRIIIHGNTSSLPRSYKRYLENVYRKTFSLVGVPVFIECRIRDNPYLHKKSKVNLSKVKRHQAFVKKIKLGEKLKKKNTNHQH